MTPSDISRYLFQPQKHYVGARWQQGRCVLDADFNEHSSLLDEEHRRVLGHLIGPAGSPDMGFFPNLVSGIEVVVHSIAFNGEAPVDVLNYSIRPGTMYLGGLRFALDSSVPVAFQPDFLQMKGADAPHATTGQAHAQLCYLRAWEQAVGAVEDEEIRERALGGADTSVRVRRMARVEVAEVEDGDCNSAWAAVRERIEATSGAVMDASGVELQSSARLRVTFVEGATEDTCAPCGPQQGGRYLGADNQAIRIMLVEPGRYAWAFNNASPLYRVEMARSSGSTGQVTMLTLPRDEARWPLRNTVVEFVPWGALLGNGQKVAERVGTFVRVTRGYDPADQSILIGPADVARIAQMVHIWDPAHPDIAQLPNGSDRHGDYLFMRVWHRLDNDADELLLGTGPDPNNHTLLRRLGLQPEFTAGGRPGDYWTVTVRPNTPQQIIPWDLARPGGVPPHGPREFLAPLALIGFRPPMVGEHAGTEVVASIHDCRPKFHALTEQSGCCTHSVGDGITSRGDFTSVQAAIDALPDGGGTVCILPGQYTETVTIHRNDVVLEGCGVQSLFSSTDQAADGIIRIFGSRVTIRNLLFETQAQVAVIVGADSSESGPEPQEVRLEELQVVARARSGVGGQTRAAIEIRSGQRIRIVDSDLSMSGSLSDDSVLFAKGEDILIERNLVETTVTGADGPWGGIQIGGGARRVVVRHNRIEGGIGHGVTLGSLNWVHHVTGKRLRFGAAVGIVDHFDPCRPKQPHANPVDQAGERYDPETAGDLRDVQILDNRIERMAGNGISVLTTLPLVEGDGEDLITVDRITIEGNTIADCVRQPNDLSRAATKTKKSTSDQHEAFGQFTESSVPPGGIVLVDGEQVVIRNNVIRDNGTEENQAICGISIRFGDAIVIEDNQITNNGRHAPGTLAHTPTTRGGIVVSLAGVLSNRDTQDQSDVMGFSLRVLGNHVEQPNGPALAARATGPLVVIGNHLTSLGNNASSQPVGRAHAVVLINLGMPWEGLQLPADEPSAARWKFPSATPKYLRDDAGTVDSELGDSGPPAHVMGHGGQILFNDNHVTLNWTGISSAGGLVAGFSVGICTRDDVIMTGNQLALHVGDSGAKKAKAGASAQQPHLSAHAAIVGATAGVSHNRIAEGVNDTLISLLVLGGLLASGTHNIATHEIYVATCASVKADSSERPKGPSDELVDRGNLVWFRRQLSDSNDAVLTPVMLNRMANQLLATLCAECLGLRDRVPFSVGSFFVRG